MKTRRRVALLVGFASVAALVVSSLVPASAARNVVHASIPMTCFPAPPPNGPQAEPPCIVPVGIEDKFVSPNARGSARMVVRDDDTARFDITLEGLAPDLVITAWISYFFPPGAGPHPIFTPIGNPNDPTEVSPALAAVSGPLAATTAGFSDGLGRDPNDFIYHGPSRARLTVDLDYNPLKAFQGPLRNGIAEINQAAAPPGFGADQPLCCPDGFPDPAKDRRHQAVGSGYLRVFDPATGFQAREANGRPKLLRSPVPVAFLAIVVHNDEMTHGISPGIPTFPIPGVSATVGDHFLLGLFDLRPFHPA